MPRFEEIRAGQLADALAKLPRDARVRVDFSGSQSDQIQEDLKGQTERGRTASFRIQDVVASLASDGTWYVYLGGTR